MSSRRRADRLKKRARDHGPHQPAQPRITDLPEDVLGDNFVNVRLSPGVDPVPPPTEPEPEPAEPEPACGYAASRVNALRAGLRARLVFPERMKFLIDQKANEFGRKVNAVGPIEYWLCAQMGIASVQSDTADDQLIFNNKRIIDEIPTCWDDVKTTIVDKLLIKLPRDPFTVARALARTKHGALALIYHFNGLGAAIRANGQLDPEQMDHLKDLMGVPHTLRNGSDLVPAATDAPALLALVSRQVARNQANIEHKLNGADKAEQSAVELGIIKEYDAQTKNLRADLCRAKRRLGWALKTLQQLRAGVPAELLLDPQTGESIAAHGAAAPPPEPKPAPAAPPPPSSDSPRTAIQLPALPKNLKPAAREALIDFLEDFIANMVANSVAVTPDGELGSLLEPVPPG